MTEFYTNVLQWGSKILYRGIKDGRAVLLREEFSPTMYVTGKKKSGWKSLYDQPLEEVTFDGIKEAKDFIKQYKDVAGFEIHGMDQYQYQ